MEHFKFFRKKFFGGLFGFLDFLLTYQIMIF